MVSLATAADIMVTGSQDSCLKSWKIDETMLTVIKAEKCEWGFGVNALSGPLWPLMCTNLKCARILMWPNI